MVPFLRYFVFVGSVLVAMLFLADWIWPSAVPAPVAKQAAAAASPFEQTIRINSARRWPDKIEFDTTRPTIVPQPAPVVAEAPPAAAAPAVADNSALEARAEIKPAVKPAPAPRRQARVRRHNTPQQDYWGRPPAFASAGPSWSFNRW